MTDNEIIKALTYCKTQGITSECTECVYKGTPTDCMGVMICDALDLINRQRAEIERLEIELKAMRGAANSYKLENETLKDNNEHLAVFLEEAKADNERLAEEYDQLQIEKDQLFDEAEKLIKEARAEARKEFAERLKEAPIKMGLPLLGLQTKSEIEEYFDGIMLQVRDIIDSLAKELTEEQNVP